MRDLLHILLRIVAGIAGALLLYIAFFLYADEEARLQNRLEQIWQWIDALQKVAMSKEVAFLHGTARTTRMGLDRLLGHKLLSVRSVAISLALSFGSFLAILASRNPHPDDKFLLGVCALVMLVLGILPALAFSGQSDGRDSCSTTSHKSYYFGMICAVALLPWIAVWRPRLWALWVAVPWGLIHPERPRVFAFHYLVRTELVVVLGVVSDALFVVFFRSTLSQIENASTLRKIVCNFLFLIAVLTLLSGPALAYVIYCPRDLELFLWHLGFRSDAMQAVAHILINISMTNLVDVTCLLLLIVVITVLLSHRIIWPLIKRPLYAVNRKGLIRNTKLLGYLATVLLSYALPNNPFVQWLTDFLPKMKGG